VIQDNGLFCDACHERIVLSGRFFGQVLVEFEEGGADRHYCERCIPNKIKHPKCRCQGSQRNTSATDWLKSKTIRRSG